MYKKILSFLLIVEKNLKKKIKNEGGPLYEFAPGPPTL